MTRDLEGEVEVSAPLKATLFESLRPKLARDGFELRAPRNQFIRLTGGITDIFELTCLDAKPRYRVQPGVAVRVERVEEIFHRTSGFEAKYQKGTATMGTRVGSLLSGRPSACQFLLESESDIPSVSERIVHVFEEVALPYFEHWGSLGSVDAELNDKPGERTIHRALAWFRCSTGLIVAKLNGRSNYEELVEFYTDVMARDNKGFYLKRFEALVRSLKEIESEG